jgi:RNA polymerase sigma factor (sigma-70 family)
MVERTKGRGSGQLEPSRIYDEFMRCRCYLGLVISRIVRGRDVEDIVQETFLRAYEASGNHRIRHPRAFLVKTARNLALNNISKMANRDEVKVDISEAPSVYLETGSAENSAELEQRLAIFCKAVQRMPKQARRAFILKKVYGLNRRDIALEMGLSESTVKKHIAKGMVVCEDYFRAVVGDKRGLFRVGAEQFDSRDKRERKHG